MTAERPEPTSEGAVRLAIAVIERARRDAHGRGKRREIEKHQEEARRWLEENDIPLGPSPDKHGLQEHE